MLLIAATANAQTRATLSSPSPGTTLGGSSVTFTWSGASGPAPIEYCLDLGNSVGSGDIFPNGQPGVISANQVTVTGIPTDGRPLYLRLWTRFAGVWQAPIDYQFLASGTSGTRADLIFPAQGSTLTGSLIQFSWTVGNGPQPVEYWLDVGSSVGSGDIHPSGILNTNSFTVSGIPTDGRTIYIRLWTRFSGVWQVPKDYTVTANLSSSSTTRAAVTNPIPGATLSGTSATFLWSAAVGPGPIEYWFDLGNSVGSGDIFPNGQSGVISATQVTVAGIPTDGRTLYVRLWTRFAGVWQTPIDYVYQAGNMPATPALLTSPAANSTLPGATVTFNWTSGAGAGALSYWLDVGSSLGQGNLDNSGVTSSRSFTTSLLPTNGATVYIRLWTRVGKAWQSPIDYQMTANGTLAALTSPTPGSTLPGSTVTFTWLPGAFIAGADHEIRVGSSVGASNYGSLTTTGTSFTVTGLPQYGSAIHVRLSTRFGATWQPPKDYTFAPSNTLPFGIYPSSVEINLSAVPIDLYTSQNVQPGTSATPIIAGCSYTSTVRSCFQQMFSPSNPISYRSQGVTGVRFFFTLAGGHWSTPLAVLNSTTDTTIRQAWRTNLRTFLDDLKAAGIQRVTPTPVFDNWSGTTAPIKRTVTNCATNGIGGVQEELVFFPWLPYGMRENIVTNAQGQQQIEYHPTQRCDNKSYTDSAKTPDDIFWQWPRTFAVFNALLAEINGAQLAVPGFDYFQETNMFQFPVMARMIYDPTHNVNVLQTLRNLMSAHGFDPGRVSPSANGPPTPADPEKNCLSIYGDYATTILLDAQFAAISGFGFGDHPYDFSSTAAPGLPCFAPPPTAEELQNKILDMAYIAPEDVNPTPTFIDTHASKTYGTTDATAKWAKNFFSSIWTFLAYRNMTNSYIVFGETNPIEPPACASQWTYPHAEAMILGVSGQNGYKASTLFQNAAPRVVMRPWHQTDHGTGSCNPSPHMINPPYNPFNP